MANKVLLFEDNQINSKLMSMFLEQSGYFVEMALSVDELQRKVTEGYEFVFIDVSSPSLNKDLLGDFVHKSKNSAFSKCPPMIAVLTSAKDSDIKEYLSMGIDGYVVKPISVKLLRETIEKVRTGLTTPAPGEDVIDIEKLSRTLGIPDTNLLINLFGQFFTTVQKELRQMRAAVTLKDYSALKNLAHSIKGSSRNLRLNNIGKLAEEIESQTKYPSASLDLDSIVNNLEGACQRLFNSYNANYGNKG
ncbi:MAG: Hpt domain-containing protein [Deferribacteraceae bacterium]|jgi:CheY-like chemotaxis protein|nr:Hpt domain-containing protein [Deferribacteraceae bacterium]